MRWVWLAAATGFVCSSALAQQPCARLLDAYNEAGKQASLTWAEAIGDDSAPRQIMAKTEINSYLLLKLINLQLIIQNKCVAPSEPAEYLEYTSQALACNSAIMNGKKNSKKCDLSTWKRQ